MNPARSDTGGVHVYALRNMERAADSIAYTQAKLDMLQRRLAVADRMAARGQSMARMGRRTAGAVYDRKGQIFIYGVSAGLLSAAVVVGAIACRRRRAYRREMANILADVGERLAEDMDGVAAAGEADGADA